MKKYKKPILKKDEVEFEDILETSLTDIIDDIFGFDNEPDEIV